MTNDYKSLYVKLFQNVTKAIELLQDAQQETEEMYISLNDMDKTKEENFDKE